MLSIEGRDTFKLLQGLITMNLTGMTREEDREQGLYCAFLNPQGRMLSTAFLFSPRQDCVLVDVDASISGNLLAFIRRFKLRSKVTLRDVSDEYAVWATWGRGAEVPSLPLVVAAGRDARSPLMGMRYVVQRESSGDDGGDASSSSSQSYTIHRILQGVPDGCNDIWENQSLPLEANVDYMHGVDFRKGCYVGQELTARTHHTGVVRKRVVPVSFYSPNDPTPPDSLLFDPNFALALPERGADVRSVPIQGSSARGKSAGKYLSGIHNIGLALLRLEQVHRWNTDLLIKVKTADESELCVRPWVPNWWPEEAKAGPPQ